ncbi:MAG: ribosome maturation factor RimM [Gemmatimonadaceae bacterium]
MAAEYLIVGRIRKPHGIRGELIVEPITDAPRAVFASGRSVLAGTVGGEFGDGNKLRIESARHTTNALIVAFDGVEDRDSAELWRDRYLFAAAGDLEPPGENELYMHDLIGMRVERTSGDAVGVVSAVYELPQGLMLEVAKGESMQGNAVMVPYREEVVQAVDLAGRVIRIDPPPGLVD